MSDESRIQELLDNLESHQTPEDVCGSDAELLSEVRARWEKMRRVNNQFDDMFRADSPTKFASPHDKLELPQIDGHDVEGVLGRGGMGVVFRARDLRLGRPVAIKMLLAGAYAGPTELMRFQLEAEAVAGLCHTNVVQIYEVGEHEGRPYFTMEFVDGGSLAQKLAGTPPANAGGSQTQGSQAVRWAAELVASLAEAVSVAHRAGIIHRDLKPGNILLTAEGSPKISDFGLARRLKGEGGLTWTGTAVGTPSYMAPEQASDKAGPIGPATDVYGLGAVLYELLTGRPPFRAGTALETFRQVLSEEPVPPSRMNSQVPRDLETVCLKCLQKDPQRRYTSAAALAEDLRRYLLGQVVAARPVSQFERAVKWIRRNKWVASLSAAVVVALVTGTVASLLFGFEANRHEGRATNLAAERKQKIIELEAEKREVEAQKREVEAQKRESDRIAVDGFLTTIGRNSQPMYGNMFDIAEADAMRKLRATRATLRLQFLETALSDPKTARRVGRRAEYVIQALIGCDRALRAEVGQRIVGRIQERAVPYEVALACARLGVALNLKDHAWAERSAEALRAALRERPASILRDDSIALAKTLAQACEHLPKAQAAEHAALAIDDAVARLREPAGANLYYNTLGPAMETLSPHLDAAAAKRTAEAMQLIVHQSGPQCWDAFTKTLLAVGRRLSPSDSAAHMNRMLDFVFLSISTTKEEDKWTYYYYHTKTLATLSGQLDPADAGRVADKIVAILGSGYTSRTGRRDEFVTHFSIPDDLASVAERLDAPGSLRTAEALIDVLKKAKQLNLNMELLSTPLFSLCRRLDAAGSARVADAIAAAVQDPKTPMLPRSLLASVFEVIGKRLDPEKAAALEIAMIDSLIADLAAPKSRNFRGPLAKAFASVGGRPGSMIADRAADALTVAICDRQTAIVWLKPLAAALAVVCDQLGPVEAYSRACEAVDALDSLWIEKTKMNDRASLADAMAPLWKRLSPFETTGRVRRVAAYLTDALGDAKTESSYLPHLAEVFTAVSGHLQPAEKVGHARRAVETLVPKLHSRGVELDVRVPMALARLCVHLERHEIARLADTVFTVLSEGEAQLDRPEVHADMFKAIVAQMDERDVERLLDNPLTSGRLQRNVLDILGASRGRHFRNTWDYLDWTKSNGTETAHAK